MQTPSEGAVRRSEVFEWNARESDGDPRKIHEVLASKVPWLCQKVSVMQWTAEDRSFSSGS